MTDSNAAPAATMTSPSPLASMTTRGCTTSRPRFDSSTTASMRPSARVRVRAPRVQSQAHARRRAAGRSRRRRTPRDRTRPSSARHRAARPRSVPRRATARPRPGRSNPTRSVRRSLRVAAGREPVDDLLAQARDDLIAAAVVEREQQVDQAERRETADESVPLDEQHVGAAARRARSRRRCPRSPRRRRARRADRRREGRVRARATSRSSPVTVTSAP